MNGIHLIAIAFLASWTVITASKLPIVFEQCPVPDTCPPKLISHEVDCTKYYECKNSQRELRTCSTGLYFSLRWRGCVDQASSDCPQIPDEKCPVPDTCPPKLIRHAECTKYYECKNSQRVLRTCSTGLYFSLRWRGCVDQASSDCPLIPTPTPTPTPTPIPTPTPDPGKCSHGELLPHECKCVKFYECINGRKALRDCPVGQHFDTASKTCVPGIDCTKPTTPPPPQCQEGELLPHECRCHKYYECKGGRKALRECNPGMHFDENSKTCVQGEDCNKQPPKCVNGDAKKHDCDCDKYYKCVNEDWMLEYCPNDEHFSKANKKCMDPLDAGCDPNIKPKPGDCSSSSPPQWPHECDCRLYYQCESRKKKIHECSWGSCFNNATLKCELQQT